MLKIAQSAPTTQPANASTDSLNIAPSANYCRLGSTPRVSTGALYKTDRRGRKSFFLKNATNILRLVFLTNFYVIV